MKLIIIAALVFTALIAGAETRKKAERGRAVTLNEEVIFSPDSKSVDVLIDYDIVKVDCHGLSYKYSVARNETSGIIYVEKRMLARRAMPCPHNIDMKDAQAGIKIKVKSRSDKGVIQTLLVPQDVKVEYIENK